jgi:hypothetical protein
MAIVRHRKKSVNSSEARKSREATPPRPCVECNADAAYAYSRGDFDVFRCGRCSLYFSREADGREAAK